MSDKTWPLEPFTYAENEPVWDDDETLRDNWSGSFYFHFSLDDACQVFVALAALAPHVRTPFTAMDQFKKQIGNQGVDWNLMAELSRKGSS